MPISLLPDNPAAWTYRRFAENEGDDDKITCAGSQQAYNEFMEFVQGDG